MSVKTGSFPLTTPNSSLRYPVLFEFFMPLTKESALRTTLDALFFKENIEAKLKAIGIDELSQNLARNDRDAEDAYFERAAAWVGDHFGGYSIYHVDGRFRAWKLPNSCCQTPIKRSSTRSSCTATCCRHRTR